MTKETGGGNRCDEYAVIQRRCNEIPRFSLMNYSRALLNTIWWRRVRNAVALLGSPQSQKRYRVQSPIEIRGGGNRVRSPAERGSVGNSPAAFNVPFYRRMS
jgi:hypothetical protein